MMEKKTKTSNGHTNTIPNLSLFGWEMMFLFYPVIWRSGPDHPLGIITN
jgi:hypothetical protein